MKLVVALAFLLPSAAFAKINFVATSTDVASIAREVGGDKVKVTALARGGDDLHYQSARPDYILAASKADIFAVVGFEMEIGWAPLVLKQSRNRRIQRSASGYCDVSAKIKAIDVPKGRVSRQKGDVHRLGNPHYWADPANGILMAAAIRDCLARVDRKNRTTYARNYKAFKQRLRSLSIRLLKKMRPHFGKAVVPYHKEFAYLVRRFRLKTPQHIERLPSVAPSPARIRKVVAFIRKNKIKVVLVSPWSNVGAARAVASQSGARLVILPIQTDSARRTKSYLQMVETCINILDNQL